MTNNIARGEMSKANETPGDGKKHSVADGDEQKHVICCSLSASGWKSRLFPGLRSFYSLYPGLYYLSPSATFQGFVLLNNRRHDLADAALQFAVVGDRRAERDFGGGDRGDAFTDHLRGVDQEARRDAFF